MAAKPVGWGMIGTRGWSDMILGPAVNAARGARLKAVLSSSQGSAARYCASHGLARGYTDIRAFLADDAIDVVWIASPNHLHKDQAVAALKAGKHVLCEKPMAMSQAECRAMIRAAKKADRLLTIGYKQPSPPKARQVPRAVAGRPLRRAPCGCTVSSTTAIPTCRTTGGGLTTRLPAAGCWATSAPTSSTCFAGSTARQRR